MSGRTARALELVEQLVAAGIAATADPLEVAGKGACVLVAPPALTFDLPEGASADWPLYAIAGQTAAGWSTWQQLDDLVDQVAELLPLTSARPASWAPAAGVDPTPAYLITYTESVD